jgi:hypothetical protein
MVPDRRQRRWAPRLGALVAAAALVGGPGCAGGSFDAARLPAALTLTWDQPDGLAQYFLVRTGIQLVRAEQPVTTLYLAPGTHVVEVQACNPSGCSEPKRVTVTWGLRGWEVVRVPAPGKF